MKQLWTIVSGVILINVLAFLVLVGFLGATGRINQDRMDRVVAIFKPTIGQEEAEKLAQDATIQEANALDREAVRLEQMAAGPVTLNQRLRIEQVSDEMALHQFERWRREKRDLLEHINKARQLLVSQRQALDNQRASFEKIHTRDLQLKQDEDFQRAVGMIEQMKPKQAKEMFQTLLARNQTDQVVDYLAAMQLRKAASVLSQFKKQDEIDSVTNLIEQLRLRGVDTNALQDSARGPAGSRAMSGPVKGEAG